MWSLFSKKKNKRKGQVKVLCSEYMPGELGTIYVQVLDASGDPANSSVVKLSLFKSDGQKILDQDTMEYLNGSNGIYKYDLTAPSFRGVFVVDAKVITEPFGFGIEELHVSDSAEAVSFIQKVEGGSWLLKDNQMIFYNNDKTEEVAKFDLFDEEGQPSSGKVFERRRVI